MTVLEAMERSGIAETTLVLAWIKDAIHHIKSNTKEDLKVNKQNIISGERDYELPSDLISIFFLVIPGTFLLDIFKPALLAEVAVSISINFGSVGGLNQLRKLIRELSQ